MKLWAAILFLCIGDAVRSAILSSSKLAPRPVSLVRPVGPVSPVSPSGGGIGGGGGGKSGISSTVADNAKKLNANFFSLFAAPQQKGLPGPAGRPGAPSFFWKNGRSNSGVTDIDLLFVMDNSGSIPAADFAKQKTFVSLMIDHAMTVGCQNSIRVAIISYAASSQTEIEFDFNDHSTGPTPRASLKSAVNSISYVGGWATNTKVALDTAHSLLNNAGRGARSGANKVVFVLTDGRSNQGGNPQAAANVLKTTDGAIVFAMGVANFQAPSSQQELINIATSPNHVFVVEDFDDMDDIVAQFGARARCNLIEMAQNRPEDWNSIIEGFKTLKQNGVINNLAALHDQTFGVSGSSHSGAGFFPWHRAFLSMIERALQIARNDDALRLPYWNWAGQDAATSDIWPHFGGAQNGDPADGFCVNTGHFKKSDWHTDPSECITRNMIVPSPGAGQASQTALDADQNLMPYETFRQQTEGGGNRHNNLHIQFGFQADMYTGESPLDPIFYFHHCFIDRLWYDWQERHGDGPSNYPASGEVYNLNTPMNQLAATYPGTTTPLLANVNWNRPVNLLKVADLGYTYEDSSGTIFQGRRRRQLNHDATVTKATASREIDVSGTSVASLKSAVLNRRQLTTAQVQQLKIDVQCRFQNDRLTPSQVSKCVRRGTTQGVRLDGPNDFEGRVEVLVNGRWYSVCDGGWDHNDASVVCRQLGHSEGVAVDSPRWSYKRTSYFVTNVQCRGSERLVQDCPYTTPTYSYCPSYAYAQVQCKSGVRLSTNGASFGYLQVYDSHRNRSGAVCGAQLWGNRQRSAACEAAGNGPSYPISFLKKSLVRRPVSQTTNYRCLFSARRGTDCSGVEWGSTACSNPSDRLYLSCQKPVRLVGRYRPNEGRVDVFHRGVWGSVCGSLWDKRDADVVCRQLGYSLGAESAYAQSTLYNVGAGVIWLDRVQCTGSESSLKKCPHAGYGATSCRYNQYAAVKCRTAPSVVSPYQSPYLSKGTRDKTDVSDVQ